MENLPPPHHIPSSWFGHEINDRKHEWVINLSPTEITELESAATKVLLTTNNIGTITEQDFPLPSLGTKLKQIRADLIHGRGFVLIKGLSGTKYNEKMSGTIFYGLGCHIGSPRSQNAAGHTLGHVRDVGLKSSNPLARLYQTNERQTFHTDSSDVVGLLCLKAAKSGGVSLLVSASTIYNEMRAQRPDLLELLLQPIATDRRGEVPEGMLPYMLIPVFSYYEGYLTVFYQRQYIDSAQRFPDAPRLTPAHVEALDLFDRLANDPKLHLSMTLEPGDMQFVYNHGLLHDRTGFEDYEDPALKRHLLRLWLSVPGDRQLPEIFKSRYGTIDIGDRGGIIVKGTSLTIPWSEEN